MDDNQKILTITVPSYNVEQYLSTTLDSICACNQLEEIEILVVNDGSKDNTLKLATEYANKYPRSVRVIDKKNGGHGSTINYGLAEAKGKYFKVVDGDDWVDPCELDKLIIEMRKLSSDLILTPFTIVNVETDEVEVVCNDSLIGVVDGPIRQCLASKSNIYSMHAIAFRTQMLKDVNLALTEHCFYVDMEYNCFPLYKVRTMSYFNYNIYKYRIGRKDQSVNWENMIKNFDMHTTVLNAMIDDYHKHAGLLQPESDGLYRIMISKMIRMHYLIILNMQTNNDNYRKCIDFKRDYLKRFGGTCCGKVSKLLEVASILYWPLSKLKRW